MPEVAGIRRTGSAALDLAWVAAGRFDGYWERGLQPWDVAAGIAAGARGGRLRQRLSTAATSMLESGEVLAANTTLHKAFGAILFRSEPGLSSRDAGALASCCPFSLAEAWAKVTSVDRGDVPETAMAEDIDPGDATALAPVSRRLTPPGVFLIRMT